MTNKLLLTGAAGFVGSHVLRHFLVNTDWDIVCPVSFKHKGVSERLVTALEGQDKDRVTVVYTELMAPVSATTAHKYGDITHILNVASESNVDFSIEEPAQFIQNNVALITSMLDYARTLPNLKTFIHVSTDEVYGDAPEGIEHMEWVDIHRPSNPYSASKAAQEAVAFSYWRTYGLPIVVTNTLNIIGETQSADKMFMKTLRSVLNGTTMPIHASSEGDIGSRFYIHARNQADALLHVFNHFENPDNRVSNYLAGDVTEALTYPEGLSSGLEGPYVHPKFNIVGEDEVNNLQLAQLIAEAAGKPLEYELVDFHSSRPGHDLRYALDGRKIAKTGWKAPVPFEESVETIVKWTLEHPEWLEE